MHLENGDLVLHVWENTINICTEPLTYLKKACNLKTVRLRAKMCEIIGDTSITCIGSV